MTGRYVLRHEDSWFYYLPEVAHSFPRGAEPRADGEPMTACATPGWWSAGHEGAEITIVTPGRGVITGYRLDDPATASERYPLELTEAEYDQWRDLDDDELVFQLYSAVTVPGEPQAVPVDGPWLRLDGEPQPDDGRSWIAELPYELRYRTEYRHLFPGYLVGFRDAMGSIVKALPGVRFVLPAKRYAGSSETVGFDVTIEVPFDKPQSEYKPARNLDGSRSRSRKGRTVPVLATRHLVLTVPYRIDAANRALAAAEWDRREAEIRAAVAEVSVAACSACMGHGYVLSGSEKYEQEPK